jgi:hypothetical protein
MYNNDIQIQPTDNGQYDRKIHLKDLESIKGLEVLKNKIIISLMTRKNELKHNPTYNNFGCTAYKHLKSNNIELSRIAIKEAIKKSLEEIKEVKYVENIQTNLNHKNPYEIQVQIRLKTVNNDKLDLKTEIKI